MEWEQTLVDTGPLVALLDASEREHARCVAIFAEVSTPLLTCWPVITEAAYLLRRHPSQVQSLIRSTHQGFLQVLSLSGADALPIADILNKYRDQQFQLADACLMHLSEREGVSTVFTLDEKDFSIYRPSSGKQLTLLPRDLPSD